MLETMSTRPLLWRCYSKM